MAGKADYYRNLGELAFARDLATGVKGYYNKSPSWQGKAWREGYERAKKSKAE